MNFTGKITEISPIKTGKTKKGDDWASLDFELTELNPQNADYPQVLLLSYFKSGEHFKYANEFSYKLGDAVDVEFNFKVNKYTKKDGSGEGKFYKNDCWKVTKAENIDTNPHFETVGETKEVEEDDLLPF